MTLFQELQQSLSQQSLSKTSARRAKFKLGSRRAGRPARPARGWRRLEAGWTSRLERLEAGGCEAAFCCVCTHRSRHLSEPFASACGRHLARLGSTAGDSGASCC